MNTLMLSILLMSGVGFDTPPFPYQLPPGSPPLLNWYVVRHGQLDVAFSVNASTRFGSPIQFSIEDAEPVAGLPLNLTWTRTYTGLIDPNNPAKGWVDKYAILLSIPDDARDTIYLTAKATVVLDAATFGWHDLRDVQDPIYLTTSRTILLQIVTEEPPVLWDRDPPILSDAQKVWQKANKVAMANGTVPPAKPTRVLR